MKHMFSMLNYKCKFCDQDVRTKTTTQCPEGKLCDDITKRVQSGQLDFVDGSWVSLKPEQESMKQMDDAVSSLIEFMEAMVPELSPETSDELTDQDIDMLKRISDFPVPRRAVRDLELSVELMVSLHKLNRLDYVVGSPQANEYRVTIKGKEFLEPKPTKLCACACRLLLVIYTDSAEDPWNVHDIFEHHLQGEITELRVCSAVKNINGVYHLTEAGLNHVNKILALTV